MSTVKGPLNSSTASDSTLVGAVYNSTPSAPGDGQQVALQVDSKGNLLVNIAVGGGGASSNVNIADVNGVPPALTNPLPVELSDGTQAFGTVANPISITGSISATNPSVGTNGAAIPTSSTEIGASDGVNLQPLQVDASKNLKVLVNAALPAGTNVIGHVIADTGSTTAVTGNVTVVQPTGTNLHAVLDATSTTTVTQATGTNLHTVVDSGTLTAVTAITNALPAGSNVIGHVIADTGSTTAVTGNVTVVQPTGTSLHAVLDTTSTTAVTQATAANLNATVVGTGTFAVQDAAAEASLVQIQQELRQQSTFPNLNQIAAFQSSASATTLTLTFAGNTTLGNSLLLVAMSNTTTKPTFAQTGGTGTVIRFVDLKSSITAPSVQIDLWRVTVAGTIIMTATFASGACAAIGYEINGLPLSGSLPNSQPVYDSLQISQGTASAATLSSFFTLLPGELPFMFVGLGANTTVSSSSPGTTRLPNFALDGTNTAQNIAASGNLQTFFAGRISGGPLEDMTNMVPTATFSGSSLFTAIYVSFKPVSMPIGGTVGSVLTQIAGNAVVSAAAGVQEVGIVGSTGTTFETTAGVIDHNVKNIANATVATAASGVQKVGIVGSTGTTFETTAGVLDQNTKNINNAAVATAASGVQKVGVVGGTGVILDAVTTAATAPANGLATLAVYQTTTPVLTTGQSVANQIDTTGALWVNKDSRRQTYRMSVRGFTPVAAASSPLFSIQGSATKTVRITHIHVSGYCTTGNAVPAQISLQKFSVLTGGVTGNTPTGALQDSGNAAQTAICLQYSTIPTTATAIGGITATDMFLWLTAGTTIPADFDETDFTFGDDGGQQLVLRGTAQYIGILLSAIGAAGPVMSIWIEWIEDNS